MSSFKNPFFSEKAKLKKVQAKLNKYKDAIKDDKIKALITKMPQNQQTLDIIEKEFSKFVENIDGDNSKDKWTKVANGTKAAQNLLRKHQESLENRLKDKEKTCTTD